MVALFKTVLDQMTSDDHKIVIRVNKMPTGQYARRFNGPKINQVVIIVVVENDFTSESKKYK